MTPEQIKEMFHKELKDLLLKFDAEIELEQFGTGYAINEKIVVNFGYNEKLLKEHNTGIVPQLIIGYCISGD